MTSSSRCSPTTRLPVSTLERQRLASRRLTSISIWSNSIEACDADPCRPRPFAACFREKPCAKRRGPRSSRGWGRQSLGRYSAAQDVLHEERASARLTSLEEAADDGDSSVFGTLHDRCQSREVTPSRIASSPSARVSQRTGILRRSRRGILAAGGALQWAKALLPGSGVRKPTAPDRSRRILRGYRRAAGLLSARGCGLGARAAPSGLEEPAVRRRAEAAGRAASDHRPPGRRRADSCLCEWQLGHGVRAADRHDRRRTREPHADLRLHAVRVQRSHQRADAMGCQPQTSTSTRASTA
jgi:hypothetical protein